MNEGKWELKWACPLCCFDIKKYTLLLHGKKRGVSLSVKKEGITNGEKRGKTGKAAFFYFGD